MKGPTPSADPDRGDQTIRRSGFSYLPRFISVDEAKALADFFAGLHPIWEERYPEGHPSRRGGVRRLTRPVYWLGAWQFAALGYYAEPDHLEDRCVRAEPLPQVMLDILERLRGELAEHGDTGALPNTCLVNYYGHTPGKPGIQPLDHARLRMHRDAEPGAVVMFSVGQPGQFEFVEPEAAEPAHSQWVRHRSVVVISGPQYKDRLYHRITRVRHGKQPQLHGQIDDFRVRRISVSFRHVPQRYIQDLDALGLEARRIALPYVRQLAEHSAHFRQQLESLSPASR